MRNQYGQWLYVCEECQNDYYTYCHHCEEFWPDGEMFEAHDGNMVCKSCLENHYTLCHHCEEYYLNDELSDVNDHGESVSVCDDCRNEHYAACAECGEYYRKDEMKDGLCPSCHENAVSEAA